jgi:hypothetical protein
MIAEQDQRRAALEAKLRTQIDQPTIEKSVLKLKPLDRKRKVIKPKIKTKYETKPVVMIE